MPPQQIVLKSRDLFWLGGAIADPHRAEAAGLYARDTRFLNDIRLTLGGVSPVQLAAAQHQAGSALTTMTNPAIRLADGSSLLPNTVSIEERIELGSSMSVQWEVRSYNPLPVEVELVLELGADFRDVFEIRGFPRASVGATVPPLYDQHRLVFRYQAPDGHLLMTRVTLDRPADDVRIEEEVAQLSFRPELSAGITWKLSLQIEPSIEIRQSRTTLPDAHARPSISTDNPNFDRLMQRSLDDLDALMTNFPDGELPAAGIPWYVAPFGRDSLITSLQTLCLYPQRAQETLRVLSSLQGKKIDPFTEEEPGKILHEMRYGGMARTGEIPHHPYFGTLDATPLFVWLFAETVRWTADAAFYRELLPAALAALAWIDEYGDTDADGMVDYDGRPVSGIRIRHRVWKDSLDSLHHPDGREPTGAITPVEVQGYVYAAWQRLAAVAIVQGDVALAETLKNKAGALRERFESAFWLEEEQYYAQALADGEPVRAITSNPGQLLMTGLAGGDHARAVSRRLTRPDMNAGWGVRTLSADALSYNPMSYHNGSVWPHDNSLIAAGCHAIGEWEAGNGIFTAMVDLAEASDGGRLNELYCGFGRSSERGAVPVPYPVACSPQAWAAGTLPLLLCSSLGLSVNSSERVLDVDPHLPAFLNSVTISGFSVLGSTGSLTIRAAGSGYEVHTEGIPARLTKRSESDR